MRQVRRVLAASFLALFALGATAGPASAAWEIDSAPSPDAWTWSWNW